LLVLVPRVERNPAVAVQDVRREDFEVIRTMQTELKLARRGACIGVPICRYERSGARPTPRYMAWAVLVVITMVAGLAFEAGVSGALGHTAASYEYTATPVSHTLRQQDGSQFEGSSLSRVCWPVEAGVDAQCFDRP
jgi:hypothetical protein